MVDADHAVLPFMGDDFALHRRLGIGRLVTLLPGPAPGERRSFERVAACNHLGPSATSSDRLLDADRHVLPLRLAPPPLIERHPPMQSEPVHARMGEGGFQGVELPRT